MTTSKASYIKDIHYVWMTFSEYHMKYNKDGIDIDAVIGDNIASLILNLDGNWDKATYLKWVRH